MFIWHNAVLPAGIAMLTGLESLPPATGCLLALSILVLTFTVASAGD